jgi:hypothetical protein
MMEQQNRLELYAAMAKAFDRLRYMQKQGTGSNAGVSVDTVKRDIGRAFQSVGLICLPHEIERAIEPHINKDNARSGYMTSVLVDFEVVHVATGQSITQRVSGQGFDPTDKGGLKAWSQALKAWGINTFMVEAGFDSELDDNGEPIDKDVVEKTFQRARKDLRDAAPNREAAYDRYAKILGYYKTHSGRPVEDPREFKTRGDALAALAAVRQAIDLWAPDAMERDAKAKASHQEPKGNKSKPGRLKIVDDDVPPILRPEPSDAELDALFAKQEKV